MHLAFGGARANGAPTDQVSDVLRRDHVQKFAASRQALAVDLDEQLASNAQTLVDAVALVQVGVVDEAFPAHRGARLFEIHAHDDFQGVGETLTLGLEASCVLQRSSRVVDGARPDHHQQTIVLPVHDLVNGLAGARNQLLDGGALDREEADQVLGGRQNGDVLDALVIGLAGGVRAGAGVESGRLHDDFL